MITQLPSAQLLTSTFLKQLCSLVISHKTKCAKFIKILCEAKYLHCDDLAVKVSIEDLRGPGFLPDDVTINTQRIFFCTLKEDH